MTSVCNQMRGKSDRRLRSSDVIGWAEPRAVSSVATHCGNCAHMDSDGVDLLLIAKSVRPRGSTRRKRLLLTQMSDPIQAASGGGTTAWRVARGRWYRKNEDM